MIFTKEQLQAIRSSSPAILVAASAGSGKTAVMTERAARILMSGVAPESVAIVTFTNGAAAEMKARIAAILSEKGGAVALNALKGVRIGTLHSFCRSIIRQFFYKIGADPGFSVADENKAAGLRRSAAAKAVELFLEKEPGFAELTDRLAESRKDEALKELLTRIADAAKNGPDPSAWLQNAADEAERMEENEGEPLKLLIVAAAEYDKLYTKMKAEKGLMDFSDLENGVLEILRDDEALATLRETYRYIFVDEYQDVNPAQEQIISLLSEGGRQFLVGDPKQSIYGFRACNSRFFIEKSKDAAHFEVVRLNDNFRSRPEILHFCNDVFRSAMTLNAGGIDYAAEDAFAINGSRLLQVTNDKGQGTNKDGNKGQLRNKDNNCQLSQRSSVSLYTARDVEDEADIIAREIKAVMGRPFYDAKTKKERPVEYSDIAILLRWLSVSYSRQLITALAARGLPLTLPPMRAGSGIADLLSVADNRRQDIPLAAVMRGPFFDFTDDELAQIRLCAPDEEFFYEALMAVAACQNNGQLKDKDNNCPLSIVHCQLRQKTIGFLDKLDELSRLADALPAAEFIDYTAELFHYRELLENGADGPDGLMRFESFLHAARKSGAAQLAEFLADADYDGGEGGEPTAAMDAIRLTTVHKSKGAEYPVVIFAGAGKAYTNRFKRRAALFSLEHGIALKPVSGASGDGRHSAIADALYTAELSEEIRVLYVALTRARERLIITGQMTNQITNNVRRTAHSAQRTVKDAEQLGVRSAELGVNDDTGAGTRTRPSLRAEQSETRQSQPIEELGTEDNDGGELESALALLLRYRSAYCEYNIQGAGNNGQFKDNDNKLPIDNCQLAIKPDTPHSTLHTPHFIYPYPDDLMRPAKTTATAMNAENNGQFKDNDNKLPIDNCQLAIKPDMPSSIFHLPSSIPSDVATDAGTAYHAAFRYIDDIRETDAESDLRALCEKKLITDEQFKNIKPAKLVLYFKSPLPAMCGGAEKIYRERGFIFDDGGVMIQGKPDLLLINHDGLTVVDYKSSARRPEGLPALYAAQLEIYARAASAILNKPVKAAYIYHIESGRLLQMTNDKA